MKKQLLIFGILIILFSVGFSGCIEVRPVSHGEETSDDLSNLGYKRYGFGLNPPEKFCFSHGNIWESEFWYVNESARGYEVIFELEDSSFTKMNVSLTITRLDFLKNNELVPRYVFDNRSLETYASDNMKYWYAPYTNVTYISNTTTTINDMNAYVSVFSGLWNETQMYKQKHVYVEKSGVVFNIIYFAIKSLYDEYIDVVDDSINSFTIQ